MTALIWLLPVAALALGLRLRSGRIRRLTAQVDDLTAELEKADARCGDLTADLATQNAAADRLHRLARYRGLQTAMERARTRDAQQDSAEWAAIAKAYLERLVCERERAELLALDAAVSTVEDGLREIGAGT